MNTELFIAKRILKKQDKNLYAGSHTIAKIATGGIIIGIAVMIITIGIVTGFQQVIRDKVIGFGAHITITNYDANTSMEPAPIKISNELITQLKKQPEVKHVQLYATKNGIVKTKTDNEGVLLKGLSTNYDSLFLKKHLITGRCLKHAADSSASNDVVISTTLASRLGLKSGDKLLVYFLTKKKNTGTDNYPAEYEQRVRSFIICGLYNTEFEDFDLKTIFVDLQHIQKLNYWDADQIGGYEISLNNYKKMDAVTATLNDLAGETLIAQTIKENNPSVFTWLELQDINAIIVIALMIMVAAINMISALLIFIMERTNMIGLLKALGSNNAGLQKTFLYTAAFLIGRGLLIGNAIGIAICFLQKQFGFLTLDPKSYYVSVIPININLFHILLLNAGTLIVCLLMLIIPSFIISKITPVKSLRFA